MRKLFTRFFYFYFFISSLPGLLWKRTKIEYKAVGRLFLCHSFFRKAVEFTSRPFLFRSCGFAAL